MHFFVVSISSNGCANNLVDYNDAVPNVECSRLVFFIIRVIEYSLENLNPFDLDGVQSGLKIKTERKLIEYGE